MKINAPRGTADVLPADSWKWQAVERIARQTAELYHFSEIRTPIFEHTELFHRGVGETSDVVTKETYTFQDRGDRSITLRPEGTAGVVRAMIEHNLLAQEGARQKVYYIGPNFRYEKPQAGRLRQHHQFGVEAFGVADAAQDVECILLQLDFYRRCGLKNLTLKFNSLGDKKSKADYRESLVQFLRPKAAQLSDDSQRRLETNPLRILDSKDPRDVEARKGAPSPMNYLSQKSGDHYNKVTDLLNELLHPEPDATDWVMISPDVQLVRGFDYYTETLWEVTAPGLGAQDAIGGGGRYDNLVEELDGRPTPAVGFGSGLERLLLAVESQNAILEETRQALIWLVAQDSAAMRHNWNLIAELRRQGFACDMDVSGKSMKAQFKLADREAAGICLIVGEDELKSDQVVVKDMKTGQQTPIAKSQLINRLKELILPLSPQSSVLSPAPTSPPPSSAAISPPPR
jgi:histidyl-tRNA synthetase